MHLQLARVGEIVRRFKGVINMWDVVNEATHFDRESTRDAGPTLTEAIRQMGVPKYLHAAFEEAREANPSATLVINDYETGPEYAEEVLSKLVDDTGRPLYDVIGIQCHQHTKVWSVQQMWEICERFAKFGKPLHFTEATILSGQHGWELKKYASKFDWASTPEGEKEQAEEVVRFYTVLFSHPAVEAITWWDLSDQGAWQGAPAGLVRQDMTPKPAYEALVKLVKGRWWTRTDARVRGDGETRFRGFFGDYRVTVSENGRELSGTFAFDKSTKVPIEVKLQ
jgi:endo-1,4-beta-xylanase